MVRSEATATLYLSANGNECNEDRSRAKHAPLYLSLQLVIFFYLICSFSTCAVRLSLFSRGLAVSEQSSGYPKFCEHEQRPLECQLLFAVTK
jgi:hypothetical protein